MSLRAAIAAEIGRAVAGALVVGDAVAARAAAKALIEFIDVLGDAVPGGARRGD